MDSPQNSQPHFQLLNHIQRTIRSKRVDQASFLEGTTLEFPPISSISVTFPVKLDRCQGVHSIHTAVPSQQLQASLQRILSKHNVLLTDKTFNRIIFTNPLKSKKTLESTLGFSVLQGMGQSTYRSRYGSLSKTKLSLKNREQKGPSKKGQNIKINLLSPLQTTTPQPQTITPQPQRITPHLQTITAKLAPKTRPKEIPRKSYYHSKMLYSKSGEEQQSNLRWPLRQNSSGKNPPRCSPWGNPENDDELIL